MRGHKGRRRPPVTPDKLARSRVLIALGLTVREAARRLDTLNDDVTDYVRENPGKCLLGALAVGVIIGKLASR